MNWISARRFAAIYGLVAVVLTGCGSESTSQAETEESELADSERQIVECLEDGGHDTSTENVHLRMEEDPEYSAAIEACAADVGVTLPDSQEVIRQIDEHAMRVVRCLEAEGWDVVDPVRGEHGGFILSGIEANIPDDQLDQFYADEEECLEGGPPGGAPSAEGSG